MGEGFLSNEDMVLEEIEKEDDESKKNESSFVRWESFLPRMFLRVLLVEGDDSTRQIIAALLKKCNYEVAAVSDGLKAWEMLKEKPHNIDLILTEVHLPSISGLSLLTMIMGHETCKNIPVIMMSSHDSISVVFKCMMRGAADFLVKPIRRNELSILWQHVWRRQTTLSCQSGGLGHGCHDGNLVQGKVGATSGNNAASNHSSDCVASAQKNKDYSEKVSDAQSSCTKPDMEAESAWLNSMQDLLQPKCSSSLEIDTKVNKCEENVKLGRTLSMREGNAKDKSMRLVSEVIPHHQVFNSTVIILEENHVHARLMTGNEVLAPESYMEGSDMVNETVDLEKQIRVEPSRETIDLIGTFENQLPCSYWHTNDTHVGGHFSDGAKYLLEKKENTYNFSSAPLLELSLRRFEPNGNQELEERHTLNHSNASAFSWYDNRTVKHAFPSVSFTEPQQCPNSTLNTPSIQGATNSVDTLQCNRVVQSNIKEDNPLVVDPSLQDKMVFSCPQLGIVPVTIPFGGMPLHDFRAGYGTLLEPMFYAHLAAPPGPPPWSTDSTKVLLVNSSHQSNPITHNPEKDHQPCDQNAVKSGYQSGTTQEKILESREDPKHILSAPDQSGSNRLCNSSKGHMKSSGCGSVCNESNRNVSTAVAAATSENGNTEGVFTSDRVKVIDCQHVSQREAALTKFRLKRKDRCYEKKVRYQSRKRLAEQRPRVKGQFVRRVQSDSHQSSIETDC